MKITDAPLEEILDAYDDPNLQQAAVEFVGLLRTFDKSENDEYIYKMEDVAVRIQDRIPYDEVKFMGDWTSEPSFVLMVTALKMIDLGYLPSIRNPKNF
mgnify:FL=1|tara:strand:+ start:2376 stop:2672 length:297 start_codon:yes stop_codon:yes gene_type:complete